MRKKNDWSFKNKFSKEKKVRRGSIWSEAEKMRKEGGPLFAARYDKVGRLQLGFYSSRDNARTMLSSSGASFLYCRVKLTDKSLRCSFSSGRFDYNRMGCARALPSARRIITRIDERWEELCVFFFLVRASGSIKKRFSQAPPHRASEAMTFSGVSLFFSSLCVVVAAVTRGCWM